ncbi:hypothetical protein FQN53_001587 [Emmonsiellopsis sp. PD_33]|nr:hypothetical protein FQN53_001587 [Emmonsiellopsis sp. PD_33]
MSSLFSNRRKARKVGVEEGDDSPNGSEQGLYTVFDAACANPRRIYGLTLEDSEPVVRRPTSKPKQKSKLRLSFGPGGTSMTDDGGDEGEVITPKKIGARKHVIGKSGLQRTWTPSGSSEHLPIRAGHEEGRPSYNQEYLKELRNSTPSTPKDLGSVQTSEDEKEKQLDIAGKFGEVVRVSEPSMIPSEAEIREKKERRARLAREEDYISLDDGGDEDWPLAQKEEQVETRLVRDDEDFAEGFDEFVEDGKISLGRKAEREQLRRQRAEMKDLIDEAQDSSEADDSEAERRAAYEAAQTRSGMDGLRQARENLPARPKTPPKITPLPRLADNLIRLRSTLSAMENSKVQLVLKMEELRKEKVEISVREVEIQTLLKEAGENYERLRAEAGLRPEDNDTGLPTDMQGHRGLENLGTQPASSAEDEDESMG